MATIKKWRSGTVKVSKGLSIEVFGRESDTLAQVQLDRIDAQKVAYALLEYAGIKEKTGTRAIEGGSDFELVFGVDKLHDEYKTRGLAVRLIPKARGA